MRISGWSSDVCSSDLGNRHPLLCPYGVVAAADGWLTLSAPTDEFWRKLATLIERPELGNDARYATVAERLKRQDEVYQAIEAFPQTKTKDRKSTRLNSSH